MRACTKTCAKHKGCFVAVLFCFVVVVVVVVVVFFVFFLFVLFCFVSYTSLFNT